MTNKLKLDTPMKSLLKKFLYNGVLYWDDICIPQRITIIKK